MKNSIRIENKGKIAVVSLDLEGEKVNKWNTQMMGRLREVIQELKGSSYSCVIFKSEKPKIFVAGADINEIRNMKTREEFSRAVEGGQTIFSELEDLPMPTIAAINGACMGGGTEFALACDYRIASDDPSTKIGLPETMLGILPGFGGCVRMPRVIGLQAALDIILAGKAVNSKKALKIGLVDQVVHPNLLADFAIKRANEIVSSGAKKRRKKFKPKGFMNVLLESFLGRWLVFSQARKATLKATKGFYPAPIRALDVIKSTYCMSNREEAMKIEREGFCDVAVTDISKNLIHVFDLTEMVKKQTGVTGVQVKPREVKRMGILGAGTMGGGVAYIAADKGIEVRMKDLSLEALSKGLKHASDLWMKLVKRKSIDKYQYNQKMSLVSSTTDYSGFKSLDLVVEAIVEDMKIKQKVIGECAGQMKENAIIVTNTSSLSVTEMAAGHPKPELFAGMHFFNPVHRMPLVEVIRGEKTNDETIATVFELSKRMGKMPVVVKDGPGFLVNRLLIPYLSEAAFLVQEGMSIEKVDYALEKKFGMPMGPCELMDAIGLDVCIKVLKIFKKAFGERIEMAACMDAIEKSGRLGQKNQKGFYSYGPDGRKTQVDQSIYSVLGLPAPTNPYTDEECIDRCVLSMVNECALAFNKDHIVELPHEVDLAMIMGTGFPPFRGGLLKYADSVTTPKIVAKLQEYVQKRNAKRLQPAQPLVAMAQANQRFYNS